MTDDKKQKLHETPWKEQSKGQKRSTILIVLLAIIGLIGMSKYLIDSDPPILPNTQSSQIEQQSVSTHQVIKKKYDLYALLLCKEMVEKVANYEVDYSFFGYNSEPWGEHKIRIHLEETKLQNGLGAWHTYNIMCEVYDDGDLIDFVLILKGTRSPKRPFDTKQLRALGEQYKNEWKAIHDGSIYN